MIAWLKLLRLPNVFTAAADVMMGFLVTHGDLDPAWQVALLVAGSCLLYFSGMVLNDVFDADVDAHEQPHRPIPSGQVSLSAAKAAGWALLSSGVLFGWFASYLASDARPGAIATLLAMCIVLYDSVLKKTPVGPIAMGACRALNVLFGMSLGSAYRVPENMDRIFWASSAQWQVLAGIGVYITGVTWFARTDARTSSRPALILAIVVLSAGMALLATVPNAMGDGWTPALRVSTSGWYLLWVMLAAITLRRCGAAIIDPSSKKVQFAVRHCVHSIIVLDAAVCVGFAGPLWGFAVLLLLFPTILLTMWLDAT